jgi:hypothetical protein
VSPDNQMRLVFLVAAVALILIGFAMDKDGYQ